MRLVVHSPGSVAVADPARDEAVAYVTTGLAADREHFRAAVLEAITLALLSHRDRLPLHAAAVVRDGRAVLLAGVSGAGKSTLACVAHDAGLAVLSEDRVWVQLAPALRVWAGGSTPGRLRLRPETAARLSEPARRSLRPAADGSGKLVLALVERPDDAPLFADRATLCILERGTGHAALERIDPPALVAALGAQLAPGFDRHPERHDLVARALAGVGGWRLTLSADPRAALPHLTTMLAEG
jgi:hypothetical protein